MGCGRCIGVCLMDAVMPGSSESNVSPETDWRVAIDYAMKLGLGNKEYELITI